MIRLLSARMHPLLMLVGGLLALLLVFATLTIAVRTLPHTVAISDLPHLFATLGVLALVIGVGTRLGIGVLINVGRVLKGLFLMFFSWRR